MGFIELNSGTKNQMEMELIDYAERIHVNATTKEFDQVDENAEFGYRNNSWDYEFSGYGFKKRSDGTVFAQGVPKGKQTPDGTGDSSRTEADSGSVRKQDRSAYQSARDILAFYAEDARKMKAKATPMIADKKTATLLGWLLFFYIIEIMRFPS